VRAGVLVGVGAGLRWVVARSVVREAGLGSGWEDEDVLGSVEGWFRSVVGVSA
jgi:hypothetical protein